MKRIGKGVTYEFDKSLVAIGADIALGVDDLTEGFAELSEFLFGAFPGKVAKVEHLGRGLSVSELVLVRG